MFFCLFFCIALADQSIAEETLPSLVDIEFICEDNKAHVEEESNDFH